MTHDMRRTDGQLEIVSRLSVQSKGKTALIDHLSGNAPVDDYFTTSHQEKLIILSNVETSMFSEVFCNLDTIDEYSDMLIGAVALLGDRMELGNEFFEADVVLLVAMIRQLYVNSASDNVVRQALSYGLSMYTCALSEKILREFYRHQLIDIEYVPLENATLGSLISINNQIIVPIFGITHIKNLQYFLSKDNSNKVGYNIRNSLAHWADISPEVLTPVYAAHVLWLFTDILNTLIAHYIIIELSDR